MKSFKNPRSEETIKAIRNVANLQAALIKKGVITKEEVEAEDVAAVKP